MLKLRLLAAAYAPLFLLLAIRVSSPAIRLTSAILSLFGVVTLALMIHARRHLADQPYELATVTDEGQQVAAYLATYLLPFLTVSDPSPPDLVAYVGFLGLVGLVL